MPIKWTPENDQLLLLKILETSALQVDAKAIAAAWPSDKGDTPTPRAITERLVKIRGMAKANGGAHFPVASSQTKGSRTASATPNATPTKAKGKLAKANGGAGTGEKRKRGKGAEAMKKGSTQEEGGEKGGEEGGEKGEKEGGEEDAEGEEVSEAESPSKKIKVETAGEMDPYAADEQVDMDADYDFGEFGEIEFV